MNARLIGVGVAALAALAGGGRLVYDEVTLSQGVDVSPAQAAYRQEDATRASRLTLELAQAQGTIATLESSVTSAADAAQRARARVESLEAELAAASADHARTVAERSARIERLSQTLAAAQDDLARADASLEQQTRELQEVRALAADLDTQLQRQTRRAEELDKQATFLSRELDARDTRLREAQEAHSRTAAELDQAQAHLDTTQTELAEARRQAQEKEAVLRALLDAGVDVGRLSGSDPMPLVRGFVVRVDTAQVPPVVLVHVGPTSGLRAGDRLYVVRNGRRAATLEVDGVDADICTTRVVLGGRGLTLAPRDEVFSWEPER
ncbi:MAG: hypothetical protein R3F62_29870 [Planctomycetota bacterium]